MRNRTFAAATFVALVFAAAAFGPLAFITQLVIRVLQGSPIAAGAELLPYAAASFAVSLLAAQVAARIASGSRWPAAYCCVPLGWSRCAASTRTARGPT
jgi:ABC-type cobalamin transport system permease subunit